jgi:hypothetical protein
MYKVTLAVQGSPKGFAYYDCATLAQAESKRDALAKRFLGVSITIEGPQGG